MTDFPIQRISRMIDNLRLEILKKIWSGWPLKNRKARRLAGLKGLPTDEWLLRVPIKPVSVSWLGFTE